MYTVRLDPGEHNEDGIRRNGGGFRRGRHWRVGWQSTAVTPFRTPQQKITPHENIEKLTSANDLESQHLL